MGGRRAAPAAWRVGGPASGTNVGRGHEGRGGVAAALTERCWAWRAQPGAESGARVLSRGPRLSGSSAYGTKSPVTDTALGLSFFKK